MTMFRTLQLIHLWTDFKLNYIFGKVLSSSFRICKLSEFCIMHGWEIWMLDPIFNKKRIKTSQKKHTKKTSFHRMCRYYVLFRNHSWFQICTLFACTPYLNKSRAVFPTKGVEAGGVTDWGERPLGSYHYYSYN